MKRDQLHGMLSGETHGITARVARVGLRCLEPAYRAAIGFRNHRFDKARGITSVSVPVLSIGNITTGGTGKTPLVRYVIEQLQSMTKEPAIVSRGYGSEVGQPNDEFLELQTYLPNTVHIQNPDRVAAANEAIETHSATAIVLDDGFQHRRLARDLDLVLIDLTCPFGFDHLLPRGLLREPISSLARADGLVLTRRDQVSEEQVANVRRQLAPFTESKRIAEVSFLANEWIQSHGEQTAGSFDTDQPVFAFCGIGNPQSFKNSLSTQCTDVCGYEAFPDHHSFNEADIQRVQQAASNAGATALVCTMKDLVKLQSLSTEGLPVFALSIQAHFESGEKQLLSLIREAVAIAPSKAARS